MKKQVCSLPCIVARITIDESDGMMIFRCPKDCIFRQYEVKSGPLDRWLKE